MADRHVALQRAQLLLVEDLVDQALVAHGHDVAALRGGDARRLLAAVLERVEREVGQPRDVAPGRDDAEDAALVARAVAIVERSRGGGTGRRPVPWNDRRDQASNGVGGAGARRAPRQGLRARRRGRRRRTPPRHGLARRIGHDTRNGITMATDAPVQIRPPAHPRADRARGEALNDAHAGARSRCTSAPRVLCPAASPPPTSCATRGRSTSSAARARRCGTSTATRCATSTTASARWSRATPTRRSARRSASATRSARTSPRRPRTRSSSARSSPAAGACRKWRYTNSGSESTMDAIRIARALHGPRHDR